MLSTAPSLSGGRGVQGSRWRRANSPSGAEGLPAPLAHLRFRRGCETGSGHPGLATTLQAGSAREGHCAEAARLQAWGHADQVQLQLPLLGARPRVGDVDSGSGKRCPQGLPAWAPDRVMLGEQELGLFSCRCHGHLKGLALPGRGPLPPASARRRPVLPDARSLTVQPAGNRAGRSEKSNSSPEVQEGPKEGCLGGAQTLA